MMKMPRLIHWGIFLVVLLVLMGIGEIFYHNSKEIIVIEVTDKERIVEGTGEDMTSKYLVFTTAETFENTDRMSFGKYNSSDVQRILRVGHRYRVLVAGWRIPATSSYRNIIEVFQEM